jgi:dTDP-4-amino-4,6-dideoxygalactose transaminase
MATSVPPIIPLTESMLPPLERFVDELRDIWAEHRLTNAGPKLREFESRLRDMLETEGLLVFGTGGSALIAAVRSLGLRGEVITTPFTFAASTHVISLNGLTPVYCDVDEDTMNISPAAIERAITPRTSAILGVHVFGTPCAVEEIEAIATRHGLKVIYDGAHAFGTRLDGHSIARHGDVQMFSFNATKLFTTGEGGCVVFRDAALAPVLRRLRRWGMLEEGDVTMPGWNGMMTEIQAALGLCNFEQLDAEREGRSKAVARYRERLACLSGVRLPPEGRNTTPALSSFVIRIDPDGFGHTRDELLAWLQAHGIGARRYFYPLASRFPCYQNLPGADPANLPTATRVAEQVLSLPLFGRLGDSGVDRVCEVIETFHRQ